MKFHQKFYTIAGNENFTIFLQVTQEVVDILMEVSGVENIGQCGRLSQLIWLLGAL